MLTTDQAEDGMAVTEPFEIAGAGLMLEWDCSSSRFAVRCLAKAAGGAAMPRHVHKELTVVVNDFVGGKPLSAQLVREIGQMLRGEVRNALVREIGQVLRGEVRNAPTPYGPEILNGEEYKRVLFSDAPIARQTPLGRWGLRNRADTCFVAFFRDQHALLLATPNARCEDNIGLNPPGADDPNILGQVWKCDANKLWLNKQADALKFEPDLHFTIGGVPGVYRAIGIDRAAATVLVRPFLSPTRIQKGAEIRLYVEQVPGAAEHANAEGGYIKSIESATTWVYNCVCRLLDGELRQQGWRVDSVGHDSVRATIRCLLVRPGKKSAIGNERTEIDIALLDAVNRNSEVVVETFELAVGGPLTTRQVQIDPGNDLVHRKTQRTLGGEIVDISIRAQDAAPGVVSGADRLVARVGDALAGMQAGDGISRSGMQATILREAVQNAIETAFEKRQVPKVRALIHRSGADLDRLAREQAYIERDDGETDERLRERVAFVLGIGKWKQEPPKTRLQCPHCYVELHADNYVERRLFEANGKTGAAVQGCPPCTQRLVNQSRPTLDGREARGSALDPRWEPTPAREKVADVEGDSWERCDWDERGWGR